MATTGNTRKKSTGKTANRTRSKTSNAKRTTQDLKIRFEVTFIVAFALCVLLFLCNFGIIGVVGDTVSNLMFGCFGVIAYILPIYLFLMVFIGMRNYGVDKVKLKITFMIVLLLAICMIFELINGISDELEKFEFLKLYNFCKTERKGGGVLAGSIDYLSVIWLGKPGTVIISLIASLISIIIVSENAFVTKLKNSRDSISERNREDRPLKEELYRERQREREERQLKKQARLEEKREINEKRQLEKTAREDEKILRMDKKVSGVTTDTLLVSKNEVNKVNDNMHEITVNNFDPEKGMFDDNEFPEKEIDDNINEIVINRTPISSGPKTINETVSVPVKPVQVTEPVKPEPTLSEQAVKSTVPVKHAYKFPPINLLTKNTGLNAGDSEATVKETARKLIETLSIFGVKAQITDISQGPTVTRFELQPELGTKVSRIKSLSDDIKLNLATSDIRIEAPIPGKAAVGIEVPNKENQSVLLRDLIDTPEFKKADSRLTFAVGKDISGKVIVYDIDQFPHLLIAGATGSGKSVCINTLIMSIIYKAHPDDVKLIMIDPKVVELSVYNGIPHLLIPVVTDPKKASAALNWAVAEMMDRYKKFADMNVRDLKGYNKAVQEKEANEGPGELYKKLPQIVVIVDELADLMMVAKSDVEDAICRLAQLARACGIHLIIATQRPSVDVITGLIKANMPSRIAFAVSSNIDSRTILDMGGAEELLGKGDMLFFPKGLKKPVRLQGAFVSDGDVNKIVDFLKPQYNESSYDAGEIQNKIESSSSGGGFGGQGSGSDDFDEYLIDAAKYIIKNDKASIGNLQRIFRIGFNRAARIMDKLAEIGVVSGDEGTKARTVLMTMEDFENYIEENGL